MKNKENKFSAILRKLLVILLIAVPAFLCIISPLNFSTLGIIAFSAILLPSLIKEPHQFLKGETFNRVFGIEEVKSGYLPPIKNNAQGVIAIIFLTIFSIITISTLNNYFYADEEVYTNNKHHILRLNSITIEKKVAQGYVLAESSNKALFDKKGYKGKITIDSLDSTAIRLRLKGFSQPIYKYGKKERRDSVLNTKSLLSFRAADTTKNIVPDTLVFVNDNNDKLYFWITERDVTKGIIYNPLADIKYYTDTAIYNFEVKRRNKDKIRYTSNVTYITKKGISINNLIDGVNADGFNLDGFNIARVITHPQSDRDERSDNGNTQYVLSLDSAVYKKEKEKNTIASIEHIAGKKNKEYNFRSIKDEIITLKFDTIKYRTDTIMGTDTIMIGYGVNQSTPFYFTRNNEDGLNIVFTEPVSHELYSKEDREKSNNIYITSSIIKDTESQKNKVKGIEIGINVPNNVLSFDIFNRTDNINRFSPFNLSFVPGHTTDCLIVLYHKDTIKSEKRVNENICINTQDNNGVLWNFSMANLREESPIKANTLMWVVFAVALASVVSIAMQVYFSCNRETFHRNTFNYVEYVMYVVLIFLVALRCFVVWRAMVFRPIENISQYEITDIFYKVRAFKVFLVGLVLFYGVIYITKLYIYLSPKKNTENKRYTTFYGNLSINLSSTEEILLKTSSDSIYQKIHNLLHWLLLCKITNKSLNLGCKFIIAWIALLFVALISGFVSERFIIVILIMSYFYVDMIIYANNKYNSYKAENVNEKDGDSIVSSLLYSLFNMIITMGAIYAMTHDTGFVIMFATFSLASIILKLLELYTKMFRNIGHGLLFLYISILPFIIIGVFTFYKEIIIGVIYESYLVLLVAVILAVTLVLILLTSIISTDGSQQSNKQNFKNKLQIIKKKIANTNIRYIRNILLYIILPVVAIVTLILYKDAIAGFSYILLVIGVGVILFFYFKREILIDVLSYFFNIKHITLSIVVAAFTAGVIFIIQDKSLANALGSHTLQRINVLVYNDEPHKALARTESNGEEMRFLQASHNNWIIEQYYNRGRNVTPIGDDTGYFKMQPQSKVGAMWNAQLTDIVLLRYIIAEHGTMLPVIILLLFVGMLYYGLKKTTYYRFTKSILIQIPLLILIQGVLVWLANTQRFIFFGQDFPLLSITSTAMVLYFFVLITLWVSAAILESVMFRVYNKEDEYETLNTFNKRTSNIFCTLLIFAVLLMLSIKQLRKVDDNDNRYTMSELFKMSEDYIKHIDNLFVDYQKESNLELSSNMHSVVNSFNDNYKVTDTIDVDNCYLNLLCRIRTISDDKEFINAIDSAYSYSNTTIDAKIEKITSIINLLDTTKFRVIVSDDAFSIDAKENKVNYAYNRIKDTIINKAKETLIINKFVERLSVEASVMRIPVERLMYVPADSIITPEILTAEYINIFDSIANENNYKFPLRIWRKYVERGSFLNSYDGLLHIHKVNAKLRIAMRDTYYDVNLPNRNKDEWKGSIVEYFEPKELSDTLYVYDKNKKYYTYYQLPKSWVREGETSHILSVNDSDSVNIFSLNNNGNVNTTNSGIESTIALHKDDIVLLNDTIQNANVLPIEMRKYWARNILVNGKQSFIYPQGKDLFWIWHFANAVKGEKDRAIQGSADNHNNEQIYADVPVTLDRELTAGIFNKLNNKLASGYKSLPTTIKEKRDDYKKVVNADKDKAKRIQQEINALEHQRRAKMLAYSVIVADANGRIHAMVDAKGKFNLNPNDYKQIGELNEMLYMNIAGDRNELERYYFDNMSFTHMKGGPGSTQKPLVWTAVASNVDDFRWKDLVLQKYTKDITSYNGANMAKLTYQKYDELVTYPQINETGDMNLTNYLSRSSNYYNAMMVYFGMQPYSSYKDKEFTNTNRLSSERNNDRAFKLVKEESDTPPLMKYGNKSFTFGRQVKLNDYTNSVIYKQFIENYGLRADFRPIDTTYIDINGKERKAIIRRYNENLYNEYLSIKNNNITFTVPQLSILNLKGYSDEMLDSLHNRWKNKSDKENARYANNGVRNLTLGGNQMWVVTPFTMAELYGKMFTLNSNYKFTLNPYTPFINENTDIGKDNNNFNNAFPIALNSMHLFFTHGTGKEINYDKDTNGRERIASTKTTKDGKIYYLYGKTGTSNERNEVNGNLKTLNEFRRLAIIISDTQLHQANSAGAVTENAKNAKFFVLYFTFDYETGQLKDIAREVINEVVNSKAFQDYMNSK